MVGVVDTPLPLYLVNNHKQSIAPVNGVQILRLPPPVGVQWHQYTTQPWCVYVCSSVISAFTSEEKLTFTHVCTVLNAHTYGVHKIYTHT